MAKDQIAAVIVNYRTPDLVMSCLRSIANERSLLPYPLEVVIVDGGSNDGSKEKLETEVATPTYETWVTLLALPLNGGFGWANNQALLRLLQRSNNSPSYVYLVNPDAELEKHALRALIEALISRPNCAAAGSQLIDPGGGCAGSAFRFLTPAREFLTASRTAVFGKILHIKPVLVEAGVDREVDWVTGASVLFRSEALRQVGLFDDGFFLYFEEMELMHRLRRAGWSICYASASRVRHIGGASTGVNGHDPEQVRRRPPYWYRSRRRYFTLTTGRRGAVAASVFWLLGHIFWKLRKRLGNSDKQEVPYELRDLLSAGILPTVEDGTSRACDWRSSFGAPPAWLRKETSCTKINSSHLPTLLS